MPYTYTSDFGGGTILAPCLQVLCAEIAQRYPDAVNLGEIGDTTHQGEGYGSDHNPFISHGGIRYVRAVDIGGPVAIQQALFDFFQRLYVKQDPRVFPYGYAHKDGVITTWFGHGATHADAGDYGHLHISVTQRDGNHPGPGGWVAALDSRAPWGLISSTPTEEDDMTADQEKKLDQIHTDLQVLMHGGAPDPKTGKVDRVTHPKNIDAISDRIDAIERHLGID